MAGGAERTRPVPGAAFTKPPKEDRMKKWIVFVILAVVVLCLAVPTPGHTRGGWGWGGGWRGGWGPGAFWGGAAFGAALAYPYYAYPYRYGYPYGYPYPYASPYSYGYTQPPQPQVYAEPQQEYWYYCKEPQGYYPYVASCPGGWMRVLPTPPPPQGREGGVVQ